MHPLCCISLESPGIGDQSPDMRLSRARSLPAGFSGGSDGNAARKPARSDTTVAGVLFKWTNYRKGWRSRWFLLRNGVLSYSKIRRPENLNMLAPSDDIRVIGDISSSRLTRMDSASRRKHHKTVGIVQLKVHKN